MEDGINDNTDDRFRRRRPVPIPIYDTDRYIEKPYLRKHELARIRDNLDELAEIKVGSIDKPIVNKPKIDMPEPKKDDKKEDDFFIDNTSDMHIPNTSNVSSPNIKIETKSAITPNINIPTISIPITDPKVKSESKIEVKPEVKPEFVSEIKKDEIKFGISNLENKQSTQLINNIKQINDVKQINDSKSKNKVIKRKVIKRMNDEEVIQYNISPEERRRRLKTDIQEVHEENATKEAIRKSAELAEQNRKELEQTRNELQDWKKSLAAENVQIKNDLKQEFGNKFNELGSKFNDKFSDITGKFEKVSGKLEETCTGIDCLKKDLANMNKNFDLTECPECGEKVVPPLASFCPGCAHKIKGWTEDDGVTPIKGWKPNWQK